MDMYENGIHFIPRKQLSVMSNRVHVILNFGVYYLCSFVLFIFYGNYLEEYLLLGGLSFTSIVHMMIIHVLNL